MLLKELYESYDNINLDSAYELFRHSYEQATGASWSKEKFLSRARNWTFYGDENGFVSVRKQNSGMIKLVGVAGSPKSIYKGIQELSAENKPIWGMVSGDLVPMAQKFGFIKPPAFVVKVIAKTIPASVLGGANYKVNNDGSITFSYVDVGNTTKFFIANKLYFNQQLTAMKDKTTDLAMKPVIAAIEFMVK